MITEGTTFSKILAALIMLVFLTILFSIFDSFYLQKYLENRDTIYRLSHALEEYKKREIDLSSLGEQSSIVRELKSQNELFVSERKKSVATARLQNDLKEIIQSKRTSLRSSQVLSMPEEGEVLQLTLRLSFEASPEQLRSILYDIETFKPALFIENMQVKPENIDRARDPKSKQTLIARIDVSGFMKIDEAKE